MQHDTSVSSISTSSPVVTMYSTVWCGDCRRAKRIFQEWGIEYAEIDIERTPGAAEQVMEWANGKRVVPTITINEHVLVNPRAAVLAEMLGRE
ncbi:MAG: glutaredoxin family protein [bacterium]|nr:glutaredoxin family protein [Candidatus Kapabacteria bacterium]